MTVNKLLKGMIIGIILYALYLLFGKFIISQITLILNNLFNNFFNNLFNNLF